MIGRVSKTIRISAAHHLPLHEGKCKEPHGHNYRIEVIAEGEIDERTGMVLDFDIIKRHMQYIIDIPHDHRDLNSILTFPTTAENLSRYWLEEMRREDERYVTVRVWETDDSYAEANYVTTSK